MDLKRILTTILGLPMVIAVFLLGNEYVIGVVVLIASFICMHEYFGAVSKVCKPIKWVGYLSNIFIILATCIGNHNNLYAEGVNLNNLNLFMYMIVFSIPIILMLLFLQVIITNMKTNFKDVAYTFLGIMYIPLFLMFLELIRQMEHGKILIGYAFVISWATDICAYIIGRNFGKHKFSSISPKKSIEGSIAGIIGAVIIALIYTWIANQFWNVQYSYLFIRNNKCNFKYIKSSRRFCSISY